MEVAGYSPSVMRTLAPFFLCPLLDTPPSPTILMRKDQVAPPGPTRSIRPGTAPSSRSSRLLGGFFSKALICVAVSLLMAGVHALVRGVHFGVRLWAAGDDIA